MSRHFRHGVRTESKKSCNPIDNIVILRRQTTRLPVVDSLELKIPDPQNGGDRLEKARRHVVGNVENDEGATQIFEHGDVADAVQRIATALIDVIERLRLFHFEFALEIGIVESAGDELIEHVVVAFVGGLERDSGHFEEVVLYDAAVDCELFVEAHLNEFAESTRIVVANRFRVA